MKRNRTKLLITAVLMAAVTLFYFKVYLPKSTYTFVEPESGSLNVTIFGIGEVDAKSIYPVGSQTGGKITMMLKDQGDRVKKGELVARIDPVDLPDLLAQSKIALVKAGLETAVAEKELEGVESQRNLAQMTFERYERLHQKGYVAQAEFDKAASELESLTAQAEASKARIASGCEEQKRSKKSIDALEQKLSRYSLYSPVDGVVISKDAQTGQSLLPSQSVVTVVDPETVWVSAYVDERISGKIRVGQKVEIRLRSQQERPLEGYVARIEAVSDPVTRERIVNVAFAKVPEPFYLNEQAEVHIALRTLEDALKIPLSVLVTRNQKTGVWVEKESRARFKTLTVLARDEKEAAVEGIGADEKILVPASNKKPLFEGTRIRI